MTPKERAELIAAKDAIIAAKDQTIIVLSDMVDDLRLRLSSRNEPIPQVAEHGDSWNGPNLLRGLETISEADHTGPRLVPANRALWMSDGEEELAPHIAAGHISGEDAAAAALQALGYANTTVELVP